MLLRARPHRRGNPLRRVRRAVDGGERGLDRRRARRAVARRAAVEGQGEKVPVHRGKGAERLLSAQGGMTSGAMRHAMRRRGGPLLLGLGLALSMPAVRAAEAVPDTEPVLSAEVGFSISANPNFRFYFVPREEGDLKAEMVDTKDLKFEHLLAVRRGLSTEASE